MTESPQRLTPAQLAEIRARAEIHLVGTGEVLVILSHIDALSQANAEQAGEIAALRKQLADCQEIIDGCADLRQTDSGEWRYEMDASYPEHGKQGGVIGDALTSHRARMAGILVLMGGWG